MPLGLNLCMYYYETWCHEVMSSSMFHLETHAGFFRLLMNGIFNPYVLWSLDLINSRVHNKHRGTFINIQCTWFSISWILTKYLLWTTLFKQTFPHFYTDNTKDYTTWSKNDQVILSFWVVVSYQTFFIIFCWSLNASVLLHLARTLKRRIHNARSIEIVPRGGLPFWLMKSRCGPPSADEL